MWEYLWIVGYDNLCDFCRRRFNDRPHFMETIGRCGAAIIHLIYKHDDEGDRWRDCYLLMMQRNDDKGLTFYEICDTIKFWDYEQIRANPRTIGARRR